MTVNPYAIVGPVALTLSVEQGNKDTLILNERVLQHDRRDYHPRRNDGPRGACRREYAEASVGGAFVTSQVSERLRVPHQPQIETASPP